jgi:cob(I)alamin adenosyltransferase
LTEKNVVRASSRAKTKRQGLVQVLTGDGRGKTSAAIGTVIRALGHGFKVYFAVFMKGTQAYGEWKTLSKLPNVTIERFGLDSFVDPTNVKPEEKESAKKALDAARAAMLSQKYDIVVLDEVNVAVAWKLIELQDLIDLIKQKPPQVELVLTGRYADKEIVKMADLVTEMLKVKHSYDKGIPARKGIEY